MTNKTTSAIDLVERLTRKVQRLPAMGGGSIGLDANGKTTATSYITDDGYRLVNPDGPEAADTITRLQAALERHERAIGWLDHDITALTSAEEAMWEIGRNNEASDIHSQIDALRSLKERVDAALRSSVGGE